MQNDFCILVENKQPCVWCERDVGVGRERVVCVCVCVLVPRHAFCGRLVTDNKHLRVTHRGMHVNV